MWQLTFRQGLFSLDASAHSYLLQKKKKNGGVGGWSKVDGFLAAGEGRQGLVRAPQWLEKEKNIAIATLARKVKEQRFLLKPFFK